MQWQGLFSMWFTWKTQQSWDFLYNQTSEWIETRRQSYSVNQSQSPGASEGNFSTGKKMSWSGHANPVKVFVWDGRWSVAWKHKLAGQLYLTFCFYTSLSSRDLFKLQTNLIWSSLTATATTLLRYCFCRLHFWRCTHTQSRGYVGQRSGMKSGCCLYNPISSPLLLTGNEKTGRQHHIMISL